MNKHLDEFEVSCMPAAKDRGGATFPAAAITSGFWAQTETLRESPGMVRPLVPGSSWSFPRGIWTLNTAFYIVFLVLAESQTPDNRLL